MSILSTFLLPNCLGAICHQLQNTSLGWGWAAGKGIKSLLYLDLLQILHYQNAQLPNSMQKRKKEFV